MEIRVWKSFESCEGEGRPFLENHNRVPFSTFDWLWKYWNHFGKSSGKQLFLVGVYQDQKITTLAPLTIQPRVGGVPQVQLLGDGLSDYLGFVGPVDGPMLQAVVDEVLKEFPDAIFSFNDISESNPLSKVFADSSLFPHFEKIPLYFYPYRDLTVEQKQKRSSSQKRFLSRLRGNHKKLKKMGRFEFTIVDFDEDREEALRLIKDLFALHEQRHLGTGNAWCEEENKQFLTDLIQHAKQSHILGFISSLDGEHLMFTLGFRIGTTFFEYIIAFHPAFAPFRLGQLNRSLSFDPCREMGIQIYDFSKGETIDKKAWAQGKKESSRYLFIPNPSFKNRCVMKWDSTYLRAKVWGRKKGFNHKIKQALGSFAKRKSRKASGSPVPNTRGYMGDYGQVKPFQYKLIADLPLSVQEPILDFVYKRVGKENIFCERTSGQIRLWEEKSREEIKLAF